MNITSVTSLLPGASAQPSAASPQQQGGDFASLLANLAGEAAGTVRAGEAAAIAGIQGSLPLQSVVERVMAAERTLQAALAVRDKAVSSYLEISRMQI
jgi:flagellar hook-basal body complex protein FliE